MTEVSSSQAIVLFRLHSKGSARVLDLPRRRNRRFWSESTARKGQTPFSVAQAKRFRACLARLRAGRAPDGRWSLCLCSESRGPKKRKWPGLKPHSFFPEKKNPTRFQSGPFVCFELLSRLLYLFLRAAPQTPGRGCTEVAPTK